MEWLINFRRLPFTLVCLSFLTGVSAEERAKATSQSWQDFQSKEGHFSIQFPSAPSIQTTQQDLFIGKVINHIIIANTKHAKFGVDFSVLPGFAIDFTGKDTIYSHATGALLKKTLGKLQSNEDIEYQGHSGKHLIYDIPPVPDKPGMYGEAYLFLVDKKLYVIDAMAPVGTHKPQVQHYLNSLCFD